MAAVVVVIVTPCSDRVDWWRVMKVLDDGADPDYERPGDGLTCLLAAATEDTDAVNYTYVDEIGGRCVLTASRSQTKGCGGVIYTGPDRGGSGLGTRGGRKAL